MGAHSFWPALYPVPWRIAEWGDDVRFIFGRSSIVARRDVSRWAMFNKVASKHLSPVELQLFILIVSTVIVAASAVAGGQEIRLTSAPTRGILVARAQLFFFYGHLGACRQRGERRGRVLSRPFRCYPCILPAFSVSVRSPREESALDHHRRRVWSCWWRSVLEGSD